MKVLFAVSNDNVSSSIIQKYQEKYKEIITSKNVYYFNAIIKELQKDKTYDAVVIGEDLEPISNNNYDTIDKFIFDKLDNISDEAYKPTGEDIPIILICSDRRTKSDSLLIKLFGIGIYNALLGNDRNIDMVCNLINKPRSKKEAKNYYKIDSEDVNYKPENESEVSETEIKNILNHYKKIGSNEKKCVESFDSIASQYNDTQLRIIVKFLPNSVKQILERSSSRYQKLVNGGTVLTNGKYTPYSPLQKNVKKEDTDFLTKDIEKPNLTRPVIIPSTMNIEAVKPTRIERPMPPTNNTVQNQRQMANIQTDNTVSASQMAGVAEPIANQFSGMQTAPVSQLSEIEQTPATQVPKTEATPANQLPEHEQVQVKRRGRPRKVNVEPSISETGKQEIQGANSELQANNVAQINSEPEGMQVKRGRGRPKKVNNVAEDLEKNNTINTTQTSVNQAVETNSPVQNLNTTESTALAEQNTFNLFDLGNETNNASDLNQNTLEPQSNEIQNSSAQTVETSNEQANTAPKNNNDVNLFDMANPYDTSSFTNPYITNNMQTDNYNAVPEQTNMNNPYEQNTYNSQPEQTNMNNPYEQNTYNSQPEQTNMNNSYEQNNYNNSYDQNIYNNQFNQEPNYMNIGATNELSRTNKDADVVSSNFVAQNKIVAFVGTSKNGTSFIVNNLAELLAQKGIKTAILDLTKNKNSYYMFTDNDQNLMSIATKSIKNLSRGIAQGVEVNKNLTVYTSLPDEADETESFEAILQTLDNNYQAILMDCDFDTNINYFVKATEIYLVQSMDALTIQPLTKFLSDLKLKNVLDETKLRVIINKEVKLKILNDKMILGGMAKYNEPSMTLQRDLFNPETIKYTTIPFEMQTYARYLEAIALCQISLSGYSQNFLASLEKLANMVYPLVSGGGYTNYSPNYEKAEKRGFFKSKNKKQPPTQFSAGVNDTLNKMRTNY